MATKGNRMAQLDVQTVEFDGRQLQTWKDTRTEKEYVSVRHVCDALGMDPQNQIGKLRADLTFESNMQHIGESGVNAALGQKGQRPNTAFMWGLDVEYLSLWIAGISPLRVREATRAKLVRYQTECAKVLHDYWSGKTVQREQLPITKEVARPVLAAPVFGKVKYLAVPETIQERHAYAQLLDGVATVLKTTEGLTENRRKCLSSLAYRLIVAEGSWPTGRLVPEVAEQPIMELC